MELSRQKISSPSTLFKSNLDLIILACFAMTQCHTVFIGIQAKHCQLSTTKSSIFTCETANPATTLLHLSHQPQDFITQLQNIHFQLNQLKCLQNYIFRY